MILVQHYISMEIIISVGGNVMKNFDDYVKRYAKENKISEEKALTHRIVQEVKKYYEAADVDKIIVTKETVGCGCMDIDDKSC